MKNYGFLGAIIIPIIAYKIIEMLPEKTRQKTKVFLSMDNPTFSRPLLKNPIIWALGVTVVLFSIYLFYNSQKIESTGVTSSGMKYKIEQYGTQAE